MVTGHVYGGPAPWCLRSPLARALYTLCVSVSTQLTFHCVVLTVYVLHETCVHFR